MGKKSYQAAERYAKNSGRTKKRSTQKANVNRNDAPARHEATATSDTPTKIVRAAPGEHPGNSRRSPVYAYVVSDLKRSGIIAAALFVILIVLAVVL